MANVGSGTPPTALETDWEQVVMESKPAPGRSRLIDRAVKDVATVTPSGASLEALIDGVLVIKPPVQVDHRGALVELFSSPSFWEADFAYAYQTSIRPGTAKGWFAHEHKIDRYHLVSGELLVLLFDDREGSPTAGCVQKLVLSEASSRQVLIPPMVWHLSLNIGKDDAVLINFPSTHYDHAKPDRFHISIDSGDIPLDVRSYFPTIHAEQNRVAGTF